MRHLSLETCDIDRFRWSAIRRPLGPSTICSTGGETSAKWKRQDSAPCFFSFFFFVFFLLDDFDWSLLSQNTHSEFCFALE